MRSKEQLKRIKKGHDCLDCCTVEEWDEAIRRLNEKRKKCISKN